MNDNDQQSQILELKRQALALKESGDTNGAMTLLAQARDLEFASCSVEELWEPLKLKQLAVVQKKRGDLEAAKQALLKAKLIERDGVEAARAYYEQQQQPQQQETEGTGQTPVKESSADYQPEVPQAVPQPAAPHALAEEPPEQTPEPSLPEPTQNSTDNDDGDDQDDKELQQLMGLGGSGDGNVDLDMNNINLDHVTFSLEEMMDLDMMTEFIKGGMPVPSDDDYQAKILEVKKAALNHKQAGDTTKALQSLAKSKQLEKVRVALSSLRDGGNQEEEGDGAPLTMDDLNAEESALLGELFDQPATPSSTLDDAIAATTNHTNSTSDRLETALEELAGFLDDPILLIDAVEMGMEIPTVAEVQAKAEEAKLKAVEYKKAGDLENAKASLFKSKQLAVQAQKLEHALEVMNRKKNGGAATSNKEVNMEDLEAMLEASENPKKATPTKSNQQSATPSKPKHKTSDELKQEAIRLRDAKQIKEAGEKLKEYKAALKREQEEAELEKRQMLVNKLKQEAQYAQEQIKWFEFYQRFVDPSCQQITMWQDYSTKCTNVSQAIALKGSNAVQISRKASGLVCAKTLHGSSDDSQENPDFNTMVKSILDRGSNSDLTDERLEIAILDVQNLADNTNLQKLWKKQKRENLPQHPSTIRIEAHLQLPPNEHEPEKSIEVNFEPSKDAAKVLEAATAPNQSSNGDEKKQQDSQQQQLPSSPQSQMPSNIEFNTSQFVEVPRGNSAYGKIIRRRVERNKKIVLQAYLVPVEPKKGGWFFHKNHKTKPGDLPPPTLLGRVVVELQALTTDKCAAAGSFPLMNGSCSKELGGSIRLVVRTGVPFTCPDGTKTDESAPASAPVTKLEAYSSMVFSVPQPKTAAEV